MALPRGRQGLSVGVLLLAYQILTLGYENIPPVTLITILAQTAIFLGFIPHLDFYHIADVCVLPNRIWRLKEWSRMIFASVVHADDMHLYYNMISFLWKGRRLERRFGTLYFAYLLVIFSVLTNVVLVALSLFLDDVWSLGLSQQCAVGFSGVIFALKVLCNHYFPHEDSVIFGWMPVSSQYACWFELVLIQLLVPNASFVGHFAGILVGLAYVHGPLKWLMDALFAIVPHTSNPRVTRPQQNIRQPMNDYANAQDGTGYPQYYHYTGGLSDDEQMRRAMEESIRDFSRRSQPSQPPFGNGNRGRLYPDIH